LQHHQNNDGFTLEKRKGLLWSIILHFLFFMLIIFVTFEVKTPLPVPVEEGLLVNFGFDETGEGLFEPAPQAEQVPASLPDKAGQDQDEQVLTQDFEEAPEVKKAEPNPEDIRKQQEAIAERIRKEQETAERLKKEEEQRKIAETSNRAKNAFGNAGNVGTSGTSEGIAGGTGNQGVESGTAGVRNYGPGGGTGNSGVSYDLAGRKHQSLPMPVYDYQGEGTVVVEVTVDKSGVVTKATAGVKGSTTLDEYLLKVARDAALKARFDSNANAPVIQKGTITYIFKLK
jgi:colicin import membrane protein